MRSSVKLFLCVVSALFALAAHAATFTNPIKNPNGSDPFMVYFDGYFYLMTTTWTNIQMTRATTIEGLKTATPRVIYSDSDSSRCCNMWAPEVHQVYGVWYIYYAAGPSDLGALQYTYVLNGPESSPWGTYNFVGRMYSSNHDLWAIDSTVLTINSVYYWVYSSFSDDTYTDQCLWIAQLSNGHTAGPSTMISCPTYSWETVGGKVNEGPQGLAHNGVQYITYSASSCATSSYAIGQLTLTGSDPLSASSWTKKSTSIFSSANGAYGPAHNGFFVSPDGQQSWLVYHASSSSAVTCDGARSTRVQGFGWNSDGSPNLGTPDSLSISITEPSGE